TPPQIIAATDMQWINRSVSHLSSKYLIQELEETLETGLPYRVYRKDIQQYCFSFPIQLNRTDITDAVLLVHLDARPAREVIHDLSLEMGGWILGLISIFIGFTYILLYYFVLRPLHSLDQVVSSRLNYQTEQYAPKFAADELGEFADKLNQLLRQTEQDFKQIRKIASIADTRHAIIITDTNGFIEWVNEGFTQLTEYTFDEVKGKKPGAFLQGPETDHRTVNQMREAFQQQQLFDVEIVNYSKTYRQYWVAIHAQPIFDAEQRLLYYFAIQIDITARKRTENALQKNAIHIHHLIEKPADSLIVMDKQGSMHYVDTISDMVLGQQAKSLINLIFNLPLEDEGTTEYFATNNTLVAEVRTVETDWEGETFYFASLRNITDKHNEIIKYEHDVRYRTAIEAMDTGLVIVDANGVVLEANIEYARLTGRKNLEDVIGNNVLDWTTIYDKERNALAIKTCMDKGFLKNFDVDYLTPEGKVTPIEVNAKVINVRGEIRILALCWEIMEYSHTRRPFYQTTEFLHNVINSLPIFIFAKEASSNHFVLWNTMGEQLFQLPAIALLGKADYEVFSEQQVDFFWQYDAEIVTYRKPFEFPEPLLLETAAGLQYFHVTKLPLLSDNQENPQFILGMLRKIEKQ
ncbi:MAG: PAS domain S-box protein, partial [Thiotrichaceae bacterium]